MNGANRGQGQRTIAHADQDDGFEIRNLKEIMAQCDGRPYADDAAWYGRGCVIVIGGIDVLISVTERTCKSDYGRRSTLAEGTS